MEFLVEKHAAFLSHFWTAEEDAATLYKKLNCVNYVVTAALLLGRPEIIDRERTLEFIKSCRNEDGGYSAYPGLGSNVTSTLAAVQLALMLDDFDSIEIDKMANFVISLQQTDGSFLYDIFGMSVLLILITRNALK